METETHLILSHRLGYIDNSRWEELMARSAEVGRLLNGLLRWLDEDVTGSRMGH